MVNVIYPEGMAQDNDQEEQARLRRSLSLTLLYEYDHRFLLKQGSLTMKKKMIYRFRSLRDVPSNGVSTACTDMTCSTERESDAFREIDAIKRSYIWFSSPSSLNDCHEFKLPIKPSTKGIDQDKLIAFCEVLAAKSKSSVAPERILQQLTDGSLPTGLDTFVASLRDGILTSSFSMDERKEYSPIYSSLMWGHYGGALNGIALGFESNELLANLKESHETIGKLNVDYVNAMKKVESHNLLKTLCDKDYDSFFQKWLGKKSFEWRYECEQRFVIPPKLKDTTVKDQLPNMVFYTPDMLKEIIVGHAVPSAVCPLIAEALPQNTVVKLATPSNVNYRIDIRTITLEQLRLGHLR